MSDLRDAAKTVAGAIREAMSDDGGSGRYRATVTLWQGEQRFAVDVHGLDLELDEQDVTLGQSVRRYDASVGVQVGDALVLAEVADSDFVAVEVESTRSAA